MAYQQTGWNDCPPILDIAPTGPSTRRRKSPSGTQLNTLDNGFLNNAAPQKTIQDSATPETTDAEILESFGALVALPNRLSAKEFAHYQKKLRTALPGALATAQHRQLIQKVFDDVLRERSVLEARSLLINFMLVNPGVLGWALPLRKVIENVVLGESDAI